MPRIIVTNDDMRISSRETVCIIITENVGKINRFARKIAPLPEKKEKKRKAARGGLNKLLKIAGNIEIVYTI